MSLIGRVIGAYEVVAPLGAGGMGEVWLARDRRLDREVALKFLPAELSEDAEQIARFRREALTLASLNHPNIATIHGLEMTPDGSSVLVLERVEGESLAQRLERGPLAVEDALGVLAQVAEALELAHERGIVHRDVKPGNVMLGPRGLVKVLDFGLATMSGGLLGLRGPAAPSGEGAAPGTATAPPAAAFAPGGAMALGAGGEPLTQAGTTLGSPGYMSPEQVLAGAQDGRTDVFAFGCVLYECLAGTRAFGGRDEFEIMAKVLHDTPDLGLLPERTPEKVRELIGRCLEKDPEKRLAEMHAARVVLEEALGIRRASALRTGEAVATPHNLPTDLTTFVGREEVVELCTRLLRGTRLLTLSGVGGCGKTRVALKLAQDLMAEHPDGVWFVSLAPLAEPERVPEEVAEALGVKEEPGRPLLASLTARLAETKTLIVLDNCEHLIEASASLAGRLLGACPGLRVLATSREGLGVPGETLFAVPTMTLPDARRRGADDVRASESGRLFVERAAAARTGFALDDGNAAAVAEICRRLDGIPLAIELAAARVRVLDVEQIRARLDDRFRLLTGGSRVALPRQQTLLATIQWSVDQLHDEEKRLFERLAAFVGGWTLERAVAVVDPAADEFEILDLLTRLVDKSLAVVERGRKDAPRYRYLETVRHFALGRLDQSGDGPAVRDRHLEAYRALATGAERRLMGADQGAATAELAAEEDNLIAALNWCTRPDGDPVTALALAGSLWRFWSLRGRYELGRRALEDAIRADASGTASTARATALVRAGGLALYLGDTVGARPLIEESLSIYRELGDRKGLARAHGQLGVVAMYESDAEAARRATEEGLALWRELGEKRSEALALHNLGYIAWCDGRAADARPAFEQAFALLADSGDLEAMAMSHAGLGQVGVALGDLPAARDHFETAIGIIRELGSQREGAYLLEGAAGFGVATGRFEAAARLLGAADDLRRELGSPSVPLEAKTREALLASIEGGLGASGTAAAIAAGAGMPFEAALEEAGRTLIGPQTGSATSP